MTGLRCFDAKAALVTRVITPAYLDCRSAGDVGLELSKGSIDCPWKLLAYRSCTTKSAWRHPALQSRSKAMARSLQLRWVSYLTYAWEVTTCTRTAAAIMWLYTHLWLSALHNNYCVPCQSMYAFYRHESPSAPLSAIFWKWVYISYPGIQL